ncbi:hypothetical protein S40293_05574 [Stachybotrys chartarum IBT 40293]|nr:hypothetical protein S40293_05574 [Stachybotrys chartarum IBT 40293]
MQTMHLRPNERRPYCGCYVIIHEHEQFLPQVRLNAHTTILSSSSRTTLTQTFANPNADSPLKSVRYAFPLYDGVSVVSFTCAIGSRVIRGVVKERQAAKQAFDEAVGRNEFAGLLDQSQHAGDVFTTSLGNIPAGEKIEVEIVYLGELKHDAGIDGLRYTIPLSIAPRYGPENALCDTRNTPQISAMPNVDQGISITVDAEMAIGSTIKSVQSPSHPISVNVGTTSAAPSADPSLHRASASLSLATAELDRDFIVQIVATNLASPTAILETHPNLPNQRALMATFVPKFNIPAEKPEIVFVCDRSGSMGTGNQMSNLIAALHIFLKSLPVGVKFNICSFGSSYDFLWPRSKTYDQSSLDDAIQYVSNFNANMGGTEMHQPLKETFQRRYQDMNLEVFLLTDGEIWGQEALFSLINEQVAQNDSIRVFSLGIGRQASHALVEGVARAGKAFAQFVANDEKMDAKVIRMLKGALSPHIKDYTLEIKYGATEANEEDDFELVEKVLDALTIDTPVLSQTPEAQQQKGHTESAPTEMKAPISLFDPGFKEDPVVPSGQKWSTDAKYSGLPELKTPKYLQSPSQLPPMFPFIRSTTYVMLSESAPLRQPKSLLLKGTSAHGPLELEMPITILPNKATTIHQLAARNAIKELEEGRGWLSHAKHDNGKLLKQQFDGRYADMVEREAVRLGVQYQVAGRWCSFVAVQDKDRSASKRTPVDETDGEDDFDFQIMQASTGPKEVPQWKQNLVSKSSYAAAKPLSRSSGMPLPSMGYSFKTLASTMNSAPRGGTLFGGFGGSALTSTRNAVEPIAQADSLSRSRAVPQGWGLEHRFLSRSDKGAAPKASPAPPPPAPGGRGSAVSNTTPQGSTLARLALLQSFSGSWSWTAELEQILGVTQKQATQDMQQHTSEVTATVCVLTYLKKKLAGDREAWEMIAEKAENWLKSETTAGLGYLEKHADRLF